MNPLMKRRKKRYSLYVDLRRRQSQARRRSQIPNGTQKGPQRRGAENTVHEARGRIRLGGSTHKRVEATKSIP